MEALQDSKKNMTDDELRQYLTRRLQSGGQSPELKKPTPQTIEEVPPPVYDESGPERVNLPQVGEAANKRKNLPYDTNQTAKRQKLPFVTRNKSKLYELMQ